MAEKISWSDFCTQAAQLTWQQCLDYFSLGSWSATQLRIAQSLYTLQHGNWQDAHHLIQDDSSSLAAWLHAHLHKVEGDSHNSRYWYGRNGSHRYEEFQIADEPEAIWQAIGDAGDN